MQPLISVIIPIFNAEETLSRCLQSVINQTMQELEILLVDDGSEDNSLSTCRRYAERDGRIRVIEKENGGVSSARNEGLGHATAPFVQFVDSDDSLVETMCQSMYDRMISEECDFVISGYYEWDGVRQRIKAVPFMYSDVGRPDDFINLFKEYQLNQLWNKLYKRELIDCLFEEEINAGEDLLFNMQYINNVKKTQIIAEPLYIYTLTNKNRVSGKSFWMLDRVYKEIYKYIVRFEEKDKVYELVDRRYFEEYTYLLKLAARKKAQKYDWKTGRKAAGEICRRNKFKSFFWIVCQIVVCFRLEKLMILYYKVRKR